MTSTRTTFLAAATLAACTATGLAQVSGALAPDLGKLVVGKTAQVYNRTLTVGAEGDRAVVRVDARAGDGGE